MEEDLNHLQMEENLHILENDQPTTPKEILQLKTSKIQTMVVAQLRVT